jgi:transcriptional regulator with XRE-family HTH domain
MDTNPHIHASALRALVDASHLSKQEIAVVALMTPGQLADLLSARRPGRDRSVRDRLAHALNVPVAAITCPCPNHSGEVAA